MAEGADVHYRGVMGGPRAVGGPVKDTEGLLFLVKRSHRVDNALQSSLVPVHLLSCDRRGCFNMMLNIEGKDCENEQTS